MTTTIWEARYVLLLIVSFCDLGPIYIQAQQPLQSSTKEISEAYYSRAEGRDQSFQVVLPANYSSDAKYPMIVQIFGSASLLPTDEYSFIRVRPSGRGVWGYRSMSRYDVMQAIESTKAKYSIDEDRIYLTGTSAGATGAMHTAALRQDVFAAVVPLVAFGNDLPLDNFRNLPLRCEHGVNDWTSAIGNVRVQFQKLDKLGYDAVLNEHPSAGHGIRMPPPETMEWLFRQRRDPSPKQIVHTCEHPRDGTAYWLKIEKFSDPHKVARIVAEAAADGLRISTENVAQFSLDPATAPLAKDQQLVIDSSKVDWHQEATNLRLIFAKQVDWQQISKLPEDVDRQRAYGAGSAANLFQGEPLMVVYGTGADDKSNQFLQQAANVLASSGGPTFKPANVRFPIRADSDLGDVSLGEYNLLLVGTLQNNSFLRSIAEELPYTVKNGELNAGERESLKLPGSVLSSHYFNPEHPDRLIYIVSPYLNEGEQNKFLQNPRHFLAGSDGFKMIDQPDLMVRGVDLRIRREMQLDSAWNFINLPGQERRVPERFSDRTHLGFAHLKAMWRASDVDVALWWGPEDKGLFGGYDFNWLPSLDPSSYTLADYLVRRREVETMTATISAAELTDIFKRWISTRELTTLPEINEQNIDPGEDYRIIIPMDLVPKLGIRRRILSDVAAGKAIAPPQVANEVFMR
ncbi:MAG: hypothetical protein H8E66_15365 [Planctomycetes bacterium]|nr:hypothetical protein [Planctomycetota bacterium]